MKRCLLLLPGFMACFALSLHAQPVLLNGDFEQGDPSHPGKPLHWDLPDGLGVQWIDAPSIPGAPPHGKAIRMDTSVSEQAMVASYQRAGLTQWLFPNPQGNAIAETYGLSLYSETITATPGKNYRITFDYMSDKGTAGFILLRAYADIAGQKKRVYEKKIECSSQGAWKTFTGIAHPARSPQPITEFKIMLFAYYPRAWLGGTTSRWRPSTTIEPAASFMRGCLCRRAEWRD